MRLARISFSEVDMNVKTLLAGAALCAAPLAAGAEELVVIVNPQNPATRMFPAQAAQFFLGKSQMFVPVDLPESSPLRAEFYEKVAGKNVGEVKAIWARLTFTGKGAAPKEYRGSADVKKAVASDPNAIGYIEKSALDGTVKAILTLP
jgi:ABC-type phosphate transport system substrate-binding protein